MLIKDVKSHVKDHYGSIAKVIERQSYGSCCKSSSSCCEVTNSSQIYSADELKGLADSVVNASLGCANPVMLAALKEGEVVLDLGSGGGIDVFISAQMVGPAGEVYGLDMTDEMLALAKRNQEAMGVKNVEFIKGFIENIPLESQTVDVVMSNCVINLSEDKEKALDEAYRVLKPGGRLAIADIVVVKDVPEAVKKNMALWVGCIAGALSVQEYSVLLKKVGFTDIKITPVHFYTKDIIRNLAQADQDEETLAQMDLDLLDGAFAGAYIKAVKAEDKHGCCYNQTGDIAGCTCHNADL